MALIQPYRVSLHTPFKVCSSVSIWQICVVSGSLFFLSKNLTTNASYRLKKILNSAMHAGCSLFKQVVMFFRADSKSSLACAALKKPKTIISNSLCLNSFTQPCKRESANSDYDIAGNNIIICVHSCEIKYD